MLIRPASGSSTKKSTRKRAEALLVAHDDGERAARRVRLAERHVRRVDRRDRPDRQVRVAARRVPVLAVGVADRKRRAGRRRVAVRLVEDRLLGRAVGAARGARKERLARRLVGKRRRKVVLRLLHGLQLRVLRAARVVGVARAERRRRRLGRARLLAVERAERRRRHRDEHGRHVDALAAQRHLGRVDAADLRRVRDDVGAVARVGDVGLEAVRPVDADAPLVAARGDELAEAVDRLHGERVLDQREAAASAGTEENRRVPLVRLAAGEALGAARHDLGGEPEHGHSAAQIAGRLEREHAGRAVKRAAAARGVDGGALRRTDAELAHQRRARHHVHVRALRGAASRGTEQVFQCNATRRRREARAELLKLRRGRRRHVAGAAARERRVVRAQAQLSAGFRCWCAA